MILIIWLLALIVVLMINGASWSVVGWFAVISFVGGNIGFPLWLVARAWWEVRSEKKWKKQEEQAVRGL
jgi:hypothetical protein